jgi:hypothetical protein
MWSSNSISVIESELTSVIDGCWSGIGFEEYRKKIYSKTDVVWSVKGNPFEPSQELIKEIIDESKEERYWFGNSKKKRYLSKSEQTKYINKRVSEERTKKKLDYYYENKKRIQMELREKDLKSAVDELVYSNQMITIDALAKKCSVSQDTAASYLRNFVDIAEIIKKHNDSLFKSIDGRKNRKFENVSSLAKAITDNQTIDKNILHDITGLSISSIYGLWKEQEVQTASLNVINNKQHNVI